MAAEGDEAMAQTWEADFIRLWQAGATQAEIAAALGIPLGTVKSRGHRLGAQGKLQPRPRGGADPGRQRQAAPLREPTAAALQALLAGQQALQDELAQQRAALDTLRAEVEALRTAPAMTPAPGGRPRPRLRVHDSHAAAETREPRTVRVLPSLWEVAMEAAATLGQPHNHFVEDALRAHLRQVEGARPAAP
jgi:hypothetical protein